MKGSAILVKKGTAAGGVALAGGRSPSISLNSETVDFTSADNTNRWRELLPATGIKTMSVSLSGVLDNSATKDQMIDDLIAQTVDAYGVILDDLGYFEGNFQLSQFEAAGDYNGEATYNITLESGGDITYTAGAPS